MTAGVGLTPGFARRVSAAVQRVESAGANTVGDPTRIAGRSAGFWARITAVDASSGAHSWRRMVWDPAAAELVDDAESVTGTVNAYEASKCRLTVGARVLLEFAGYDGGGGDVFRFSVMPRSGLFAVKVTQTGGSAGDATTQCSFTYTVKTLDGTTIGTGMTPQKKRASVGAYEAPAANSYGTAFYDEDGDLVLFDPNEVPDPETC